MKDKYWASVQYPAFQRTAQVPGVKAHGLENHRIIEYQVGRELKGHLVQPLSAKVWSRHEGPAPRPTKSSKCPMLGNPPLPWRDYSNS